MIIRKKVPGMDVEVDSRGFIYRLDGTLIPDHKSGKGYRGVTVNKTRYYVHKLVALAFRGECPEKHEVNHINGIRDDNRAENLEYVTSSQNTLHAVKMGRWPLGSKRWNAKLNERIVLGMRSMYACGDPIKNIAECFGATYSATYHAVKAHGWRNV